MKIVMRVVLALALCVATGAALAPSASASHAWGNYHWGRTSNPFTVKYGDNVSSQWDSYLVSAAADWSQGSSVLDMVVVPGTSTNARKCSAPAGRVEVCNTTYGFNGWLGIAGISLSGGHIVSGYTKLNDSYFNTATYNKPAWRNLVTCQEIAHNVGLAHQDENFNNANLNTCMDYTNLPDSNQHPNSHDFQQLASIYNHVDSTNTIGASVPTGPGNKSDHTHSAITTIDEHGNGHVTHILWAE